jgi:hypothetical protein
VLSGAAGIGIGLALGVVIGAAVAYAFYPDAAAYSITGRGGALSRDMERVWEIRAMAAWFGFLAGLTISQTALLIEAVQSRGGRRPAACAHCGYDFRGHAAAGAGGSPVTCPECGRTAAEAA